MSAKQTANQETKIENCPMPECGGECTEAGTGMILCANKDCPYRAPSLAAHNALATASARPKKVGNYEDMAVEIDEAICQAESTCRNHACRPLTKEEARQIIAAKLSELMQPKDVAGLEEQRDALLAVVKDSFEQQTGSDHLEDDCNMCGGSYTDGYDYSCDCVKYRKAIANCEATK